MYRVGSKLLGISNYLIKETACYWTYVRHYDFNSSLRQGSCNSGEGWIFLLLSVAICITSFYNSDAIYQFATNAINPQIKDSFSSLWANKKYEIVKSNHFIIPT